MGDVDDPEIYLAAPVYEWQQTEAGQWVMENAQDLKYDLNTDYQCYGYRVTIHGKIDEKNLTYYRLKYG